MNATLQPGTPSLDAFPLPEDPAACGFDESLLYDPARYENHRRQQLNRPAPAAAGPAIPLPGDGSWQPPAALVRRRTHRRFAPEPIARETFARALAAFRHTREGQEVRTLYPSTGGLYGIDVYLHVKTGRVEQVAGGIYYYHPAQHALCPVGPESALVRDFHHHHNRPIFTGSAFTVLLVFNPEVTAPVYGPASHLLACIETGIMLTTFNHIAESLDLGLCCVGLVDFANFGEALALPPRHQLLHVAEVGPKVAAPPEAVACAESATDFNVAGLRRFLAAALPDYMVPAQFVVVDAIPLTPNNKIDREALLKLADDNPLELGTAFVATETEMETGLVAMWRQVLKADRIGAEDNFFDLGGDSMGIAEVRRLIADQWKLDVPILKLFQYPTIRATARFLVSQMGAERKPTPATRPLCPAAAAADPGPPAAAPLADVDRQALAWLQAHPDDPRAPAVRARLEQRGISP